MKRYFFLKLGLSILVCAYAIPRSPPIVDNFATYKNENKQRSNKNESQTIISSSLQGDPKNNVQDYQGVMGKPGVDFPVLTYIPRTKFTCRGKKSGYYADLETNCQVFHICDEGRKVSFLCPNGTIFQQSDLICDWWFKVDCATSPSLYDESAEQLYEENVKRKENRKVQEQERRANKIRNQNNKQQSREFDNNSRKFYTSQTNLAKKDVNQYISNQNSNRYDSEYNNNYKETQVLSETASFVNNRYNNEQQKKYYKNHNESKDKIQTYEETKAYSTGENNYEKLTTEKVFHRGSRTFSSNYLNNKVQYKNQISDSIKTTTQHTIYSPTVPPFTSTRYTTSNPVTTQTYKTKAVSPVRNKPSGFYITKNLNSATAFTPFANNYPSTTQSTPYYYYSTNPSTTNYEVDKNSQANNLGNDNYGLEFRSSFKNNQNNENEFLTTTKVPDSSTSFGFEDVSVKNTITPSIPTPFRIQLEQTTYKSTPNSVPNESFTKQYNQNTYLPKSNEKIPTPKPTIPTEYTTVRSYPTVTDNLNNMIKTLEKIDQNPVLDFDKNLGQRPGLHIPPSAGPKTLHSLAIYFATALDNLVNDTANDDKEIESTISTIDDGQVTLLSRSTQEKFNSLFDEQNKSFNETTESSVAMQKKSDVDLRTLVEHDAQYNDLDSQQSRGLVSSTPRIRQLAQVFTQALSAYLDDPDTFKKVLEEIRPTEPSLAVDSSTMMSLTTLATTTEYRSYTKEEDEVLDFSDADKSSTYKPFTDNIKINQQNLYVRSSTESYLNEILSSNKNSTIVLAKRIPTPNSLALDLNNRLKATNASALQDIEAIEDLSHETNTESDDYFPFNTGEDENDAKIKATAKPYGLGVKPANSTPINFASLIPPTAANWDHLNLLANDSLRPAFALLPPFKESVLDKNDETNNSFILHEELQSAHSQAFVPLSSTLERSGKNLKDNSLITTETTRETTTVFTTPSSINFYSTYSPESTTSYEQDTTPYLFTSRQLFDETTTDYSATSTTTEYPTTHFTPDYSTTTEYYTTSTQEQTTQSRFVPDNHWSTSPEVTKLWESTLYIDPLIINRNLSDAQTQTYFETNSPTTIKPDYSTQTTTEYEEDIIDLKFASTTEEPFSTLPLTTENNEIFTTVIDLGIHNLLNSTELEIASSQARQIFGNLKSTEQDLLIEKMKEAESNTTVRRLILLLVSTCDASLSNNKTVQETRNSILHALLNLPPGSKPLDTNTRFGENTEDFGTTLVPIIESTSPTHTILKKNSDTAVNVAVPNQNINNVHEDTRALELLRSLYSLAAKWGKK